MINLKIFHIVFVCFTVSQTLGITAGCVMASTDTFRITLTGAGTHAAAPHLGNNPIPVLFGLVRELMLFAGQKVSPVHNYVLSITHVEAGEAWNVIPDTAMLEGTIRCEYPEDRETLKKALYRLVDSYAEAHQVSADIYWHDGAPAVLNDEEMVQPAAELTRKEGFQVKALEMAMTGDDFSHYKEYAKRYQVSDPELQPQTKPLALYVKVGTGLGAPPPQQPFQSRSRSHRPGRPVPGRFHYGTTERGVRKASSSPADPKHHETRLFKLSITIVDNLDSLVYFLCSSAYFSVPKTFFNVRL